MKSKHRCPVFSILIKFLTKICKVTINKVSRFVIPVSLNDVILNLLKMCPDPVLYKNVKGDMIVLFLGIEFELSNQTIKYRSARAISYAFLSSQLFIPRHRNAGTIHGTHLPYN